MFGHGNRLHKKRERMRDRGIGRERERDRVGEEIVRVLVYGYVKISVHLRPPKTDGKQWYSCGDDDT